MNETELIELAASADAASSASASADAAAAWEALVREHQQPVFRLAYLFTGDPDEAEDVAQETFIRAYHAIHRADPHRPLRPWLLAIAANLARNRLRGIKRYLSALQRLAARDPQSIHPIHPGPEMPLETRELWGTIRTLSLEDQQVIYLRYFLELPEAHIAAALGVAPGTVKSRLHRALNRLRARLGEDPAREDAAREDAAREGAAHKDAARKDAVQADPTREGTARDEPAHEDPARKTPGGAP